MFNCRASVYGACACLSLYQRWYFFIRSPYTKCWGPKAIKSSCVSVYTGTFARVHWSNESAQAPNKCMKIVESIRHGWCIPYISYAADFLTISFVLFSADAWGVLSNGFWMASHRKKNRRMQKGELVEAVGMITWKHIWILEQWNMINWIRLRFRLSTSSTIHGVSFLSGLHRLDPIILIVDYAGEYFL